MIPKTYRKIARREHLAENTVHLVIEEMLISGGSVNRVILGGGEHDAEAD